MRQIVLTGDLHNGATVWTASAVNDDVVEYDSASTTANTPLDALLLLANELYEEVYRLSEANEFEHPSVNQMVANLNKCAVLGGHNYGQDGRCIRPGCGRYETPAVEA